MLQHTSFFGPGAPSMLQFPVVLLKLALVARLHERMVVRRFVQSFAYLEMEKKTWHENRRGGVPPQRNLPPGPPPPPPAAIPQ